ncbi:MAG: hypothetical protein ACM3SQ_16600 [Betaproteobacteria bacterium]
MAKRSRPAPRKAKSTAQRAAAKPRARKTAPSQHAFDTIDRAIEDLEGGWIPPAPPAPPGRKPRS